MVILSLFGYFLERKMPIQFYTKIWGIVIFYNFFSFYTFFYSTQNLDVCIKLLNDPSKPGEWVSVYCSDELAYVCQMPPDSQWELNPSLPNRCLQPGYQSYFQSCYKFVTNVATYADAKAACVTEGAVLASFPDRYELAFAETVMHYNQVVGIWIGLERDNVSDCYQRFKKEIVLTGHFVILSWGQKLGVKSAMF